MTTARFRLSRAGVLNVWQYDEQVFDFADGRLLLRGANGAGKSKTLEMLLPFALDGDKLRMTASGRHHTSLVWLMTDGYEGNRTGYVWVEFARELPDGEREVLTCGVGVRASSSAKSATTWFFTCPRAVGDDLQLEDDAGPLSAPRLREALPDGQVFERAREYKAHVGRVLFGLDAGQYDELLRLLYWLRQPQVGEDIEPAKLAEQLAQALPQVDDDALRAAGDTFDELRAFGEQIDRRDRAARGVRAFADVYAAYARMTTRSTAAALLDTHRELSRRTQAVTAAEEALAAVGLELAAAQAAESGAEQRLEAARARERELESSPEARSLREVLELERRAEEALDAATRAATGAGRARSQADAAERRVRTDATQLVGDVAAASTDAGALIGAAGRAGVSAGASLPAALAAPVLAGTDDVAALTAAVQAQIESVQALRPGIGRLLAAVEVVEAARQEAEAAERRRRAAEERAADAERRAEAERGRREDAARAAREAEARFASSLETWRADARGVPLDLGELTADVVGSLPSLAANAAAGEQATQQGALHEAATARLATQRLLTELAEQRGAIDAEADPAPPAPALERTARDDAAGAPLWRLVDVAADGAGAGGALLEAALQDSGLLDAWVRADGAVLDGNRLDVVLPVGSAVPGRSLADVLRPDVADGSPVSAATVTDVLRRVAVVGSAPQAEQPAAVDLHGGWRLGPLTGRAAKPERQYLGATARAAERQRRLDEVDARIAVAEAERTTASAAEQAARARLDEFAGWLRAVPDAAPVLRAWTVLDERVAAAKRANEAAGVAEQAAVEARAAAASASRALHETAGAHGLPVDADGLAARSLQLRELDADVARHVEQLPALVRRLDRWAEEHVAWHGLDGHALELERDADAADREAGRARSRYDTVREAAGAGIEELERRLSTTRADARTAKRDVEAARPRIAALREQRGAASTGLFTAQERRAEQAPAVAVAAHALAALVDVPGCLASSGVEDADPAAFELARGTAAGDPVPAAVLALARHLAALEEPVRVADAAAVYAALQAATSSDAAEHEPRVVAVDDVLAALGRDDGGEHPMAELARRVETAVEHDRTLLTERERTLFEEHLVGDLGELLRQRRVEADELVESMNQLLHGVTTSQGIAVKLDWRLRDDVPDDARRAVVLLGRAVALLTATERAELRDALHRLIEASRAEAPDESYSEHLARALDYRRWSAFRVRYTRPEYDGSWKDLNRRSPLSQGEQKVVCYLPLFAAAAAHFTSLAGAAPHAPRFVLLDDAFPKIDVRTHPLLFGLLVDLDLDFVVTSERLWGDHATVPSLAIYEALRDPAQRGVAQYRYSWDGSRLSAVGA
jgi:uncharacterized protein (TIGR02680 family)